MSDLYFNQNGKTHYLRLRALDTKPGEVIVWEALINGREYIFFQTEGPEPEIWELFELAISEFRKYRVDETIVKTRWRDE